VRWIAADITRAELPAAHYDVWHDRAVFHFLTDPTDRARYVAQVLESVKPGGYVIVAAFGPGGPLQCSGLDVVRYAPDALHAEFGAPFRLLRHETEIHRTPAGGEQEFVYCYCVRT
jgi:SAM-dependent methyltransferase